MNQEITEGSPGLKNRAINISLITFCMGFQTVGYAGIALFMPMIRHDLGLSFTQGGALSAATFLLYALMQIPAGYLADRYGVKRIFFTGVFGTSFFCLALSMASGYWHAILIQGAAGFFMAFIFASGVALLGAWFGPKRRATAMALSLIGISLGHLLINMVGPSLSQIFTWRCPFVAFGSAGLLASFVYLLFGKGTPLKQSGQRVRPIDVFQLFRHRFMWVCGAVQYVRLGVVQGVAFWLPSLLIDEKGLSLQIAGLIIALRTLMVAPTNIVGGYMSDRLKKPTLVIGFSLVILAITTTLIVRVDHMVLLILLIVLNALFIQLYFGPLFALPIERYGTRMTGTLSGFSNFFANLGGLTFSFMLGLIKDKTGHFESGFYIISGACLIGLLFTILLEKMRRRHAA